MSSPKASSTSIYPPPSRPTIPYIPPRLPLSLPSPLPRRRSPRQRRSPQRRLRFLPPPQLATCSRSNSRHVALFAAMSLAMLGRGAYGAPDHFILTQVPSISYARVDPIVKPGGISGHVHNIMGGSAFASESFNSAQRVALTRSLSLSHTSNLYSPASFAVPRTEDLPSASRSRLPTAPRPLSTRTNPTTGRRKFRGLSLKGRRVSDWTAGCCTIGTRTTRWRRCSARTGSTTTSRAVTCSPSRRDADVERHGHDRDTNDTRTLGVMLSCDHGLQTPYLPNSTSNPGGCGSVSLGVFFPSCGLASKDLDSADHFSHMTWPTQRLAAS